ncbi:hypothetical protein JCM10450v2_007196 [Rhodotorula kratochvilovae]
MASTGPGTLPDWPPPHAQQDPPPSDASQQPPPAYPQQPAQHYHPEQQHAPPSTGFWPSPAFASHAGSGTGSTPGVSLSMLEMPQFPHLAPFASAAWDPPADRSSAKRSRNDDDSPAAAAPQPAPAPYASGSGASSVRAPPSGTGSGSGSSGSARTSVSTAAGGSRKGSEARAAGVGAGAFSYAAAAAAGDDAESGEDEPGGASEGAGKRIVQRADKSCKKCRERRVRCDRAWPACARCKKRREACEWTDITNVDEVEEGGDAERIAELRAKVASLERQLKTTSLSGGAGGAAKTAHVSPAESSSHRASSDSALHARGFPALASQGAAPRTIPGVVQDIWTKTLRLGQDEGDVVAAFVGQRTGRMDLGRGNVHWRLGQAEMARHLTFHLMDAALYACCSKLPGIKPLADRIDYYKAHLETLDPAGQCAVAVLCALGARASPHSQLLGVSAIHLQDGTPSPPAYLYAGERRELACRQLEARARELVWSHGFFDEMDVNMLDSMVGLVQLLIYEEVLPRQSRFFARNAIGMYFDIRHEALDKGERTSADSRIGPGCALFLADAIISSACSRPSYITTGELDQYIVTDGVAIPDFPNSDLGDELRRCTQRPLTVEKLVDALTTACLWVCGCARLFAQLSTGRRPGAASTLPLLKSLWKLIDKVHNAIQELQQLLVSLQVNQVTGCEDQPFGLEHFVLLGVRYDSLLIDLINLQHVYLMRDRNGPGIWSEREDDALLRAMRQESELRVRKCLKLASFYAQLYLQSQDKHLVHHMLMQLEMLPDWTTWAAQRVGQPGGPVAEEYEVSVDELDWFQQALELSSYYTPKAAHRLQALTQARARYQGDEEQSISEQLKDAPNPLPYSALPTVDHLNAQRAAVESHMASNPRFHYDLPPGNNTTALNALSPPDDPQHMFQISEQVQPSPEQLYVFDSFGIAASHGQPLDAQTPVPGLEFVQAGFGGPNKWAELGVRQGAEALQAQYAAHGAGEDYSAGGDWMRSAGRGEEAELQGGWGGE